MNYSEVVLLEIDTECIAPCSKRTFVARSFYEKNSVAQKHITVATADICQHFAKFTSIRQAFDRRSSHRVFNSIHAACPGLIDEDWRMSRDEYLPISLVEFLHKET